MFVEYGAFLDKREPMRPQRAGGKLNSLLPRPCLPRCADYGKKLKLELAGLSEEEIDRKLQEAVEGGDHMRRSYAQSIQPFQLPTVIE